MTGKLPTLAGPNDWKVVRHSGRNGSEWRQRFVGSEPVARSLYLKLATDLRQGGVRLINPAGEIADAVWAPRLRSRW